MGEFLLEIGTEEIPAGYIRPALEAFSAALSKQLDNEGLEFAKIHSTATPRRLIFFVTGLAAEVPAREIEVSGPPIRIAFGPDGKPTRAAEGFAKAQGVAVADICRKETEKGGIICIKKTIPARPAPAILAQIIPGLIKGLTFPKSMYWRDPSMRFARPLRRILALFDHEVVKFEIYGVKSGRVTVGHPFVAPDKIEIASADYEAFKAALEKAFVIVDRDARRALILSEIENALKKHGSSVTEWDLLEEVTDLVEWPEVLEGSFDPAYLALPPEVVSTAMMEHQRYFPVHDRAGKLTNRFITIVNRPAQYRDGIREGNERVLAARLNDARFFWGHDVKEPLEDVAKGLANVVYLAGLGSLSSKVARLKELSGFVAGAAGKSDYAAAAVEAASLSKADLLTEMVFEFPSLQGVMGRAYALAQGKDPTVAAAIEEHYLPRTLSGELPKTDAGRIVAIADKADTLAGAFVMGLLPSGSQDPYGLRRAAVGILRIIVEGRMRLSLRDLLEMAWKLAADDAKAARAEFETLHAFVRERIYQYYLDRGYRHDVLRACLAPGFDDLLDFVARLDAVTELSKQPFWPDLVTAVERTYNITKAHQGPLAVSKDHLKEPEEQHLYSVFCAAAPEIEAMLEKGQYVDAGQAFLQSFGEPLHTFFEKVFVNVEDERVRANRLSLIKGINVLCSTKFADLALIVQEGETK